ncbi:class I SAM-dependent methyltransferase [Halosimplex pelagicum]|uniref:Class I SAM-dependent methyltransferase n=1 Tax=Halosimplex pelagicum TaxID=869886 RepID=A0A7D5TTI7_9EURY|nr:class I SAM-dependent methyltransferase [Halosimplex pelagicum]QLH81434.1 class I SAM-dependent methyltransferase [Halosimplex pelagicum]
MSVSEEFDEWARDGRDEGMEERHWHTAKHALARMPVEEGDTVLDLGSGSGYAGRALRETKDAARTYGVDAAPRMARNAREYTDDPRSGFLNGDFEHLPFAEDSVDHCWSMEAFFYARDPDAVLDELRRVLRPGGTFYCAVNYWEESVHTHKWDELVEVPMIRWTEAEYRERFRAAGLHVAGQDRIPNTETTIPPAGEFPTEDFETREAMVERYREHGTLLTVGVVP